MKGDSESASGQEQAIKGFLRDYLGKQKDGQTISHILAEVGDYYDADRAYIFELNAERTHASNTCEWCREGVSAEISSFDKVHSHIGAAGDAQKRLNYFCKNLAEPGCTEELLAFVNLSTLNHRMEHSRMISKQYRSTLFSAPENENATSWRECSFIEGDRDAGGRLAHVIFTTQSIHDAKVRELEAQQKLQEANENLTALLAAEKQHTAIIGAMSNVYFGLYYIDLEENTFQELAAQNHLYHTLGEKGNASRKWHCGQHSTPRKPQTGPRPISCPICPTIFAPP